MAAPDPPGLQARRRTVRRRQLLDACRRSVWRSSCSARTAIPTADALRVSGAFEMAHGGTLLLKEVADLPLALQGRLARRAAGAVLCPRRRQDAGRGRRARARLDDARPAGGDRRRPVPRGPVPPPERGVAARAAAQRAPRGHSRAGDRPAAARRRRHRPADAADRRGHAGRPAGPRLAGQRAPAAQRHRAAADPGAGRRRPDPRRRAAQRRQRGRAVGAALGEGRRDHAAAAARRARGLRARVSAGPGHALRRQYLAHRDLRRHGALGAASQAEVARPARRCRPTSAAAPRPAV